MIQMKDLLNVSSKRLLFMVKLQLGIYCVFVIKQENKRYENPHKAFTFRMHGFESVVGPVKVCNVHLFPFPSPSIPLFSQLEFEKTGRLDLNTKSRPDLL